MVYPRLEAVYPRLALIYPRQMTVYPRLAGFYPRQPKIKYKKADPGNFPGPPFYSVAFLLSRLLRPSSSGHKSAQLRQFKNVLLHRCAASSQRDVPNSIWFISSQSLFSILPNQVSFHESACSLYSLSGRNGRIRVPTRPGRSRQH